LLSFLSADGRERALADVIMMKGWILREDGSFDCYDDDSRHGVLVGKHLRGDPVSQTLWRRDGTARCCCCCSACSTSGGDASYPLSVCACTETAMTLTAPLAAVAVLKQDRLHEAQGDRGAGVGSPPIALGPPSSRLLPSLLRIETPVVAPSLLRDPFLFAEIHAFDHVCCRADYGGT
jgi:hypothetical protein